MKKWSAVLSILFMAASIAFAQYGNGCSGMMGYGGMFMGLLFLVLIALVVYFVIQAIRSKETAVMVQEKPIDILKRRYAKGEITKEQFEQMKKDLES